MSVLHVPCHAARCVERSFSSDHFSRNARSCSARHYTRMTVSSARVRSKLFAATASPDVVAETAPSSASYEQSNKATTQQSTGASHVKPCYPERTINCSDGALYSAVINVRIPLLGARQLMYHPDCRGVEGQGGLGSHLPHLPQP